MEFFLGIDLGASALKACLLDRNGRSVAATRAAFDTHHPKAGYCEQNPADWIDALRAALSEMRRDHAQELDAVAALSLSGGAHIGVLCDGDNAPLRPAIMWSDQRAAEQAAALAQEGDVLARAGNAPNATWTLPQLIWLNAHEPNILTATEKLFFAKDWLAAQLTDKHISDRSEAVGSLMAGRDGQWDKQLITMSGLKAEALPTLVECGTLIGRISARASEAFGLPQARVYQGAIDTSMEWLCATPLDNKTATLKLASAGVISLTTDTEAHFPPISFYPHIMDGLSYHASGMSDCMGAIEFIRQNFTPTLSPKDFEAAAMQAEIGAEGVLFYPYLSGARAPFWQADLRAEMHGLTRGHAKSAIARAAYEGVGHVLTAIWRDLCDKTGNRPPLLHILGGGAGDFFCQMLADMLNVTLQRGSETDCAFATALFAAASHHGDDPKQRALAAYQTEQKFTPDKAAHAVYDDAYKGFMTRHKR